MARRLAAGESCGQGRTEATEILLARRGLAKASFARMSSAPAAPAANPPHRRRLPRTAIKVMRLVLAGVLLGFAYDWASPLVYKPDARPGFWLGSVHGALMPMALPSLLLGKDVPIHAQNTQGRIYKIGYITGINLCGLIFFGAAFWQPRPPRPGGGKPETVSKPE